MENDLALKQNAIDALDYVKALEVKDQQTLNMANKAVVRIGVIKKGILAYFKDPKSLADAAHKAIVKKEKEALEPLIAADIILKPKIGTYVHEQIRIKEEAERKRLEEINRAAEKQLKALEEAAELENKGKIKEAEDKLHEAEELDETKEIPLPPAAPIMSGTHTVTLTHWRVIDHELIPRRYLRVDSISVDSEVKLHKMKTKIPGIEVYEQTNVRRSRS